ncbi:MAG: hypothetical protein AVDCRST_MAG59-1259, partial [uncultured Thermomicrobiales bacterium]
ECLRADHRRGGRSWPRPRLGGASPHRRRRPTRPARVRHPRLPAGDLHRDRDRPADLFQHRQPAGDGAPDGRDRRHGGRRHVPDHGPRTRPLGRLGLRLLHPADGGPGAQHRARPVARADGLAGSGGAARAGQRPDHHPRPHPLVHRHPRHALHRPRRRPGDVRLPDRPHRARVLLRCAGRRAVRDPGPDLLDAADRRRRHARLPPHHLRLPGAGDREQRGGGPARRDPGRPGQARLLRPLLGAGRLRWGPHLRSPDLDRADGWRGAGVGGDCGGGHRRHQPLRRPGHHRRHLPRGGAPDGSPQRAGSDRRRGAAPGSVPGRHHHPRRADPPQHRAKEV